MLGLVGLGALFVIGCAQEKKCDQKQYDDFLSEVRNWEERAEAAWTTGNTNSFNHDRVSDVRARSQPDIRVWRAQSDIVQKMDRVEFTLKMYGFVKGYIDITEMPIEEGKKALAKRDSERDSRFKAYLAAKSDLADAISAYTTKRWEWDTK